MKKIVIIIEVRDIVPGRNDSFSIICEKTSGKDF